MISGPDSATVQRERASLIDRLMGLSDALFAIAMTLLILNIEVPDLPEGRADELADDLAALDTTIYVWLLSFVVLALLWRAQHLALDRLRRLDNVVVVLNFVVLALATAIPFSSELLGEYSGQSVAVVIYAANIGVASLAIAAISWWSDRKGNQLDGVVAWDPLTLVPGGVFLASIPIALVSPELAPYVWLGTLLVVPLRKIRRRA